MWALAVTEPNRENRTAEILQRQGIPHQLFWLARHTSLGYRLVPAFSRYIFIPIQNCWEILREVPILVALVRFGDEVARVSEHEMNQLRARCNSANQFLNAPEIDPLPFQIGQRVRVFGNGIMSGHEATFAGLGSGHRLRLMFEWMGRQVPILIDSNDVVDVNEVKRTNRGGRRRRRRH